MATDGDLKHLTSEQIQEFLDQQLTPQGEALVREHLGACTRCQSETEAWGVLFSDLGSLPELDPGPAFLGQVLQKAPVGEPVGQRARGWLGVRTARRREDAHIPAGSIQDYLENLLPPQPAARLEAHLGSCSSCREEVQEWESLLGSFQPLGHFAPRPGFSERVMAQILVPAPVPVAGRWSSLPGRAVAWTRGLLPKTRQGWAVAGGVASAPTITMAALIYLVFSRPLLTPGAFGSYLLWKATALADTVVSAVSTGVVESTTLFRVYSWLEPLTQSPFLLGLGGLALSLISAGALWVLYRNLIITPSDDRYARAQL
ncbi:MAG: zf-HC2 domain-containing protein [Longimicrobiales bacterium]|nr:zf-HC2 domain-containing protein [Longimicrobiales bacterium]